MEGHPFNTDLDKNDANYVALSPLSFLNRSASTFPNRTSMIYGNQKFTWHETKERCLRLASALKKRGIKKGDTISILAPNVPPAFEVTFGVPMTGAVLNALNTRLDSKSIAFILEHAETKVLITDTEYALIVSEALEQISHDILVIDYIDPENNQGKEIGSINYENFLKEGDTTVSLSSPDNEWDAISLNYTSGTTGNPKGVVYHHRGAYLNSIANSSVWGMKKHPVYLWTLPMFHCNGWCFPWTITMLGGTHICLRRVEAEAIFRLIIKHEVTHMCGAPVVMNMLVNADKNIIPSWLSLIHI